MPVPAAISTSGPSGSSARWVSPNGISIRTMALRCSCSIRLSALLSRASTWISRSRPPWGAEARENADFSPFSRSIIKYWPGRQVPGELAGLLDVVQAVFAPDAGKTNDRRNVVERIEEAVGRQVQVTIGILRRNPADGARADDGVERVMGQAVAVGGFVEVDVVGHGAGFPGRGALAIVQVRAGNFQSDADPCGSGLAREEGVSVDIIVECHTAFASKPAPTVVCVDVELCVPPKTTKPGRSRAIQCPPSVNRWHPPYRFYQSHQRRWRQRCRCDQNHQRRKRPSWCDRWQQWLQK